MKSLLLCFCVLLAPAVSTPAEDAKPIAAVTGQEFKVTLASNPTTGYSWALAKPLDGKLLALVTNIYERPETRLVGAGGNEVWTFKAVAAGKADIAFKYIRPWETNVPPVRTTNLWS